MTAAAERPTGRPKRRAPLKRPRRLPTAFGAEATGLALDGYDFAFRRGSDSSKLIVVLSPNTRFTLLRHRFRHDVLFVTDKRGRYYLIAAERLARTVLEAYDRGGYDGMLATGQSKGGFGALLLTQNCAKLRPDRAFHALAFSPQVTLYPRNPGIPYRSYVRLLARMRAGRRLWKSLRRHGDVSLLGFRPNAYATIAYADREWADRREAERMLGPNVRRVPVAGTFHGSIFYFIMRGKPRIAIRSIVEAAYARRGDADLAQSRPRSIQRVVQEIHAAARVHPTFNELCDITLATAPRPPRLRERAGRMAERLRRFAASTAAGAREWLPFGSRPAAPSPRRKRTRGPKTGGPGPHSAPAPDVANP